MYFTDLTPCSYVGSREPNGISVGWLDKAHSFPRGAVPTGFIERLAEICERPVVCNLGYHACEFCNFEPDPTFERLRAAGALSSTVIRIVGRDGRVYLSPEMICHYVTRHGYQPPEDFVRAVMDTDLTPPEPAQGTVEGLISELGSIAPGGNQSFQLWVPQELTLRGKPVRWDAVRAILLDKTLAMGFTLDGFTAAEGGTFYKFKLMT